MGSLRLIDNAAIWTAGIPNGWQLVQLKHVVTKLNRVPNEDDSVLICTNKGTVIPRDEGNPGLISLTNAGHQGVEPGDLLIHGMDTWHGAIAVSSIRGQCTSVVHVCDSSQDKRFIAYYLRALAFRGVYKAFSNGVRQNTSDFRSWVKAGEIPLILPTIEEQRRIADYLDAKCAEIDAAEEAAEASIGDYLSMRHALISNAVTHGVDGSNRARKDLGVPYVDGVPVFWSKAKLVWLLSAFIDCPHETPDYSADGPFLVIRAGDQTEGGLVQDNMLRLDSGEYERRTRRSKLLANDIVYGREGNWGKASIIPETDKYCLGQRMMQFRCNESKLEPRFATYALNAEYVREQGRKDEVGSTSRHVNVGTIANYWLAVPPIDEQLLIADYLDSKCAAVDCAIALKQSIIDDLKAYKQSLIYEVVTGKREV